MTHHLDPGSAQPRLQDKWLNEELESLTKRRARLTRQREQLSSHLRCTRLLLTLIIVTKCLPLQRLGGNCA